MYSIILPTFNEKKNIILLINQIKNIFKKTSYEIIVVDDNSYDDTYKNVLNNFKKDKKIFIYLRKKNRSLAESINLGLKKSHGKYIMVMDTDFNHNPKYLKKFIKYQKKFNLDFVSGSRFVSGGSSNKFHRHILSKMFNLYIQLILRLPIKDSLSGFFLIKKNILKKLSNKKIFLGYGEYFIRLCYYVHKYKFNYKEIGVVYGNRKFGRSKSKFVKMFFIYSLTAIKLLIRA